MQDTQLESILRDRRVRPAIPGLSIAVLHHGEITLAAAFACRGSHDECPVDTDTVFETASLTKPLVSFIDLQLAEEERRMTMRASSRQCCAGMGHES
jgi:CubicO group peptidase (beta-lactamase class C family)